MEHHPITPPTPPTPNMNDTAAAWGERPSLRKILFAIAIIAIFWVVMHRS
jgi:hypothetical protein